MISIPIKIGRKEYVIKSDSANFMVGIDMIGKDGKSHFKGYGYFPTLQGLFNYLLTLKIRKRNARTFEELLDVINKAEKELSDIWKLNVKK